MPPGVLSKFALVKGATWGTAATLTTGHRARAKSCTLDVRREQIPDESLLGRAERGISRNGPLIVEGALENEADYRQVDGLLQAATFMGTAGAPASVETGVKLHTLDWTADVYGKFLTAGKDLGGNIVHGFNSIKPTRRNISLDAGGKVIERFDYVGRGFDDTLASSGWTWAIDPVSDAQQAVLGSHMVCRFNAQSGGALDATNNVYPVRLEIDAVRGLDPQFGQAPHPEEPLPGGFAEISISMTFYKLSTALRQLFHDAHHDETNLKGTIVFSWPVLLGATKYPEWANYFPMLRVVECPNPINGPQRIPFSVRMTAHACSSAPTGFPANTTMAWRETRQIALTTDILA